MSSASEPSAALSAHPAPLVPEHVLGGALSAVALTVADLVHAGLSPAGTRVSPGEFLLAGLHLGALYVPVGAALGLALGVLFTMVRRARWLGGLREVVGRPAGWTRRDPEAFGAAVAFFAVCGALVWAGDFTFDTVRASVHREALAGLALGGVVAAAFPVGVMLHAALSPFFAALGWLLGRAATLATVVTAVALAVLIGLVLYLRQEPDVAAAYPPATLAMLPTALAFYVAAAFVARRWLEPRRVRVRRAVALGVLALAPLVLLLSGLTYGRSNRVRSVVEQRSVLGRRLVRFYASLSDRDGDRHPWTFGGGDCDDGDPTVYPGAPDPEGDGVDADCFRGDGSPDAAPRGDGAYGAVPPVLARPSFLVVTIDALRRDHLGSNGYARDTSPEIDRFLSSAVELEGVVPQSSRSLRSIPSMWTGLYASEIAFGPEYLWPSVLPENVTAAEVLRDHGYATQAVVATDYFERVDGFFQGFDEFVQHGEPDPPRDWAVNEALPRLRRLAGTGQPFLLWVHLYNCHAPYLEDGAPSRFGGEPADLYDTEIGLAGAQLERLLDELERLGASEHTVVVLASDHGEGFGEHGSYNHSTTLYEEEMVSLLALRVPGVAAAARPDVVGLLDLMPTLTNLAGIPLDQAVSGHSLVPLLTGERPADPARTVFAELLPDGIAPYDIKVARRGDEKLLWWVRDGTFQYFDLASDPGERHDLSDERRDDAEVLLGELRAWVARASRAENSNEAFVALNRLAAPPRSMTHPLDLRFPNLFTVLGFDLPPGPYHPGGLLPLTFYYRVDRETDRDLFFVADILGPPGVRIPAHFHAWHYPLHSRYHTDSWRRGEILRDPTPIVIPEDLVAPVSLRLVLTVREGGAGGIAVEGLERSERGSTFDLTTIEIVPAPAASGSLPPGSPSLVPPPTPTDADAGPSAATAAGLPPAPSGVPSPSPPVGPEIAP